MKNLFLNNQNSNTIEVLSRNELKNVKGGDPGTCYNICMSGYYSEDHTQQETDDKTSACDGACS
jgi:hypothetical protein